MARKIGPTRRAVNASVKAAKAAEDEDMQLDGELDAALVVAARNIAQFIDDALDTGNPERINKAIYITPHLMNIMREMYVTPKSRNEFRASKPEKREKLAEGTLHKLQALRTPQQRREDAS